MSLGWRSSSSLALSFSFYPQFVIKLDVNNLEVLWVQWEQGPITIFLSPINAFNEHFLIFFLNCPHNTALAFHRASHNLYLISDDEADVPPLVPGTKLLAER